MSNNTEIRSVSLLLEVHESTSSRHLPGTNKYLRQSIAGVLLAVFAAFFVMLEAARSPEVVVKDFQVIESRREIAVSSNNSRRQEAEQIHSSDRQASEHLACEKSRTWPLASGDWNKWFFGSNEVCIN